MRKRRWRSAGHRQEAELNITAFMNLMVVLVPFLLVMAVFSRLAILELNLPAGDAGEQREDQQALALELVVYDDLLDLNSQPGVLLKRFPHVEGEPDLAGVGELLRQVKSRYPDRLDISLLLAPDISYDVLVQVMDTVRMTRVLRDGKTIDAELFPEISIGDAPLRNAAGEGGGTG
jgi:biopolymer transport protein ExbD